MSISISHGTLTQVQSTLSPDSEYNLPTTVTVSGATSSYNSTSGQLILTFPTSSMSVTAAGVAQTTQSLATNNIFLGNSTASYYVGDLPVAYIYVGDIKIYEAVAGLTAPTLSIDGSIVSILHNDNRTTSFDIYLNNTYNSNIVASSGTTTTLDLAILNLGPGSYTIKVKAKASSVGDSNYSNEVTYALAGEIILDQFTLPNNITDFVFIYDA